VIGAAGAAAADVVAAEIAIAAPINNKTVATRIHPPFYENI
jgi:hypothetical protein